MNGNRTVRLLQRLPVAWELLVAAPVGAAPGSLEHCLHAPAAAGCRSDHGAVPELSPVLPGRDLETLPAAVPAPVVELRDGDRYTLRPEPVTRTIAGVPLRLYGYNRSVPGPLLKIRQAGFRVIKGGIR